MKKFFTLVSLASMSVLSAFAELVATPVADINQAVADGTVVTLSIGEQYLYGPSAQNTAMGDIAAAAASTNAVIGYKIEKEGEAYLFRCVASNGGDYGLWGKNPCYLNSQPTGGVTFNLGKDQDVTGGSSWTFEADGSLKNVGSQKFFNGTGMSDEPVTVTVVTFTGEADPEPEPDPIVIPESLKPFISGKTVFTLKSGDNFVYGPSQQNLAVGTWEQASSAENNANGYVLEADDYYFYFRAVKADGSDISAYNANPCWLNNNGGNVVFNMGKDQDTKNGSSWTVAETAAGKYTIESVNQKGKYLAVDGTSGTLSETAVEWEFYVPATTGVTSILASDEFSYRMCIINGKIVIIKNGVMYDVNGRRM